MVMNTKRNRALLLMFIIGLSFIAGMLLMKEIAYNQADDYKNEVIEKYCGWSFVNKNQNELDKWGFDLIEVNNTLNISEGFR